MLATRSEEISKLLIELVEAEDALAKQRYYPGDPRIDRSRAAWAAVRTAIATYQQKLPVGRCWPWTHKWTRWQKDEGAGCTTQQRQCVNCGLWQQKHIWHD